MKPYDIALRERAVGAVLEGSSARAAAARFKLAPSTVTRWLQRLDEEGELEPRARPARGSVLDGHAEWLAELRAADPSLSCRAIVERLESERGVQVHETTLWYWLRRQGVKHKKPL